MTAVDVADRSSLQLAARLREAIYSGRLRPGERLLQEKLAADLGVTRTPLREALRRLEGEGLITLSGNQGVQVVRMDPADVLDMYDVRELLDGLAARLAALRRTQAELDRLRETVAEMDSLISPWQPVRWLDANSRFHSLLYAAARNRSLDRSVPMVRLSSQTFYPSVSQTPARARTATREHHQILDALAERDGALTERLARAHVRRVRSALAEQIGDNSNPLEVEA